MPCVPLCPSWPYGHLGLSTCTCVPCPSLQGSEMWLHMEPCHCRSSVSVSVFAMCPCAQDRLPLQPPLLVHACLAPPQGLTAQGAPPRHGDSGGAPGWTTPQVSGLHPSALVLLNPTPTSFSLSCLVTSESLTCVLCMDHLPYPAEPWTGWF